MSSGPAGPGGATRVDTVTYRGPSASVVASSLPLALGSRSLRADVVDFGGAVPGGRRRGVWCRARRPGRARPGARRAPRRRGLRGDTIGARDGCRARRRGVRGAAPRRRRRRALWRGARWRGTRPRAVGRRDGRALRVARRDGGGRRGVRRDRRRADRVTPARVGRVAPGRRLGAPAIVPAITGTATITGDHVFYADPA